ncbi:L-fuculose phosphate aldolase [uncultured archaeon]|nr:L-fuculose phosphate aldolase [uncultured archaeon]
MSLASLEIARFGKKVVAMGLTSSRFGNISQCLGEKMAITCTGSMLDELDESQVIELDLSAPSDLDKIASSETIVHRAIYTCTSARAVIHTHSPYAVSLSLLENEAVEPLDSEGILFMGSLPIVEGGCGTDGLAKAASIALQSHKACIARGHGVFAIGKSLAEAYTIACMAEHSSQVKYLVRSYPKSYPHKDE